MKVENSKKSKQLAEHFFRHESAKMVSVITRYFGLEKVNMAEDVVQDTLLEAINHWEFKGIPENPRAWLYTVAKNKTLNILKREKRKKEIDDTVEPGVSVNQVLFTEDEIADDQLRMMFACCHPSISNNSQVALILKTLCGLSIGEIAKAFLTTNETINKRLVRARKCLRDANASFEIPDPKALPARLDTVLRTIYLLFNEGYSASAGDRLINYELCLEAIRLTDLIAKHQLFEKHTAVNALQALMLLNAARFDARIDRDGSFVRMVHQDRLKWNQRLIASGLQHLEKIRESDEVGLYHILATISAYHCIAKDYDSTNWKAILELYNTLLTFDDSPVVQLNRVIAFSKVNGSEEAIKLLKPLKKQLPKTYHLYESTMAEMYMEVGQYTKAIDLLKLALDKAQIESEKVTIRLRIQACKKLAE